MKFNGEFAVRQIGGVFYAVPTGKTASEMKCMIKLNESAAFLWEKAASGEDEDALCSSLALRFGLDEEKAKKDVSDFIATLKGAKIID